MAGIGLDLLEIARLEAALERTPKLAQRVFTDAERRYAAGRARPSQHLAARFCAKEAVSKALAMDAISWRDIEIVNHRSGAPKVRLSGRPAARAAELGVEVHVSLTHTHTDAAAVALLCRVA